MAAFVEGFSLALQGLQRTRRARISLGKFNAGGGPTAGLEAKKLDPGSRCPFGHAGAWKGKQECLERNVELEAKELDLGSESEAF